MSSGGPESSESGFAEALAAFDEVLASGRAPAPPGGPGLSPELADDLKGAQDVLMLFEAAWPRAGPPGPGVEPGAGAAAGADSALRGPGSEWPEQFGRFRLLRMLGGGGGGCVFLAQDPALGRKVALKVPKFEALMTPELRRRFLREAKAAAALDHPNLVPVFEVGEAGPICYIVSAYCEGISLSAWLRKRDRPMPPVEAARMVADLADAVEHAHARGVLHRDIKPANVLMTLRDGPGDAGGYSPRLTDFGLARLAGAPGDTRTGAVLGTPSYMAPEQAEGRRGDVGPPTDVYALGVMLYELLTQHPPFRGDSDLGTLRLVVADEPVPPRRLRPSVQRDLEVICLKCLEKDPRRRYPTAEALGDDLARFLAGVPIRARPIGPAGRVARWANRNRPLAAMTAAAAALLALVVAGTGLVAVELGRQASRERQFRRAETAARLGLEAKLYFHRVAQAQHEWLSDNPSGAAGHLDACPEGLRGWEWHHLRGLARGSSLELAGHRGWVHDVAFAPNGRTIASSGADKCVRLWDARTGRELRVLPGDAETPQAVEFHPGGGLLATAGHIGAIRLWDPAAGRQAGELAGHAGGVEALAFRPDGSRLASGGRDGWVRLWDPATGREVGGFEVPGGVTQALAFSPDGRLLATAGDDGTARLWSADDGAARGVFPDGPGRVQAVAFTPDGLGLFVAGEGMAVRLREVATGRLIFDARGHAGLVTSLAVSRDGVLVASSGEDGRVRVWDARRGRLLMALNGHNDAVRGLAFSPDGRSLASAGWDGTVRVWDVTGSRSARPLAGPHDGAVSALAVSRDGRRLASAGRDRVVTIRDAVSGEVLLRLLGHDHTVLSVAFIPDGDRVVTAGGDSTVRIWDAATGREIRTLEAPGAHTTDVAVRPDGRLLAAAASPGGIRLWTLDGEERPTLGGHRGPLTALAFSPDGAVLAAADSAGAIKLWRPEPGPGRVVAELDGHLGPVEHLAFSADGRLLASAGFDRTVRVWDVASGRESLKLLGHNGFVTAVEFAPDGRRLASTGWDGTVRIWDAATGQLALTLDRHGGRLRGLAFSPDGHRLFTGGSDGVVDVWDATPTRPSD